VAYTLIQKLATEFIGTFLLSFTVCATGLYGSFGNYAPFVIASNLMLMIYAGRHISGGHYNSAITVSIYLRGIFDKNDILPYIIVQLIAAVSAALVVMRFSLSEDTSSEILTLGIEAIIAETTPIAFKFLNEGPNTKNKPAKVIIKIILIFKSIFSLSISNEVTKTIIG
jgi:aquaporin Z